MSKKIEYSYVKEFIENKNGLLLTKETEYRSIETIINVKCLKHNIVWNTTFHSLHNGLTWCRKCYDDKQRYSVDNCNRLAKNNDGLFLSQTYEQSTIKYEWKCKVEDHPILYLTFTQVQQGQWCKVCNKIERDNNKLKICEEIAKQNNGFLLSKEYLSYDYKYTWMCKEGHVFDKQIRHIKNGSWCDECKNNIKQKIKNKDCHNLAYNNDGYWLSDYYITAVNKYLWQCEKKHLFEMTYNDVKTGYWCPECQIFKTQKRLTNIVQDILKVDIKMNYKKFNWLKGKRKMEIDIWVPELKIAIEYDGAQHFGPVKFGGCSEETAKNNFKIIQERDQLKNKLILEHPEDVKYFIRFNYMESLTKEYVVEKLKNNGITIKE